MFDELDSPPDRLIARRIYESGRSLEHSGRAGSIREEFLLEVAVARNESIVPDTVPVRSASWRKALPVLARAATATALVMVLLFSVGLVSTRAMPGSPLYPVKRVVEKAGLYMTPSGSAAVDARVTRASERLEELDYATRNSMRDWYLPLIQEARSNIEEATLEASRGGVEEEEKAREETRSVLEEHDEEIREAIEEVPSDERGDLEEWVEDPGDSSDDEPEVKEDREPDEREEDGGGEHAPRREDGRDSDD
ncbi:MAG: hypothetical protein KKF41_11615 [Actinobacteria bacterium]|nr:hypothetical protein [Actinomycetota bacterium]MBU1944437.1 hypothetical protein [Actinomycetota bacterium]MBU2688223.1 hypothetical protein [Actinomycetota bacterium]